VILAVPPHAAASILPLAWVQERAFLDGIRQPPAVIVTLFLDGPLEPDVWSYVFRPDPGRLVSFCSDAARKNPAMVPSGRAALQAWICYPAAERALAMAQDELVRIVLGDLEPGFPGIAMRVQHAHVHRIARALPQSPPGHNQAALRFLHAMDRRTGIALCGNYLTGGYMECALWSAERAVSRVNDRAALNVNSNMGKR
jgi:protoporphyrinogen oxidase